jgi:hypothetical protein
MSIPGKAVRAVDNYRYHSSHAREAQRLIAAMKSSADGPHSRALFKQCDEYARDVLGSRRYSPWLKAYAAFSGTFKEGWIPDNYYGKVVVPRLAGGYGEVSNFKPVSKLLFQTDLIPDLAYSVNGLLYTPSMESIPRTELKKYLFAASEKVVYKLDNGYQGRTIFVYDQDSFPEPITFSNGVFQSYIAQHPFFAAFNSQSVSTLRITTVVDDESNVSYRASYLKLPRSADTHVKAATAIKVIVNSDGGLGERAYLPNWIAVAQHPDSKQAFAGQVVPNFQACVEACVSLHRKMMFSRLIGWDVTTDVNGDVVIMEWNGFHNGIYFSETVLGPRFADLGWENLWRTEAEAPGS